MARSRLAQYAYNPKYPPLMEVYLGETDITDDVIDIQGLGTSLDVMRPTTFQTRSVRLILSNASDRWTLLSDSNIFTEGGYHQRGFRAPITVRAGYIVNGNSETEVIFKGRITNSDQDAKPHQVVISVSDDSQLLNRNTISDFGIQRYLKLRKDRATEHGRYAIPGALREVSEGSLSGTSGGSALVVHNALETEGDLNPLNVSVEPDALESEGDFLPEDPQVEFKSPFRWKQMQTLVKELLESHGVTDYAIEVPKVAISQVFFETKGRVGYDVLNTRLTDQDDFWSWAGHLTDAKYHADTGDYLFLYSHRRSDFAPRLIQYQSSTQRSFTLAEGDADMEWWQMHLVDSVGVSPKTLNVRILGTDVPSDPLSPTLGAYNAVETGNGVKIWGVELIDTNNRWRLNSLSVQRSSVSTFKPQLAQAYWFGYTPDGANNNERQSLRPDTRKGFRGRDLYIYARANDVGITNATSALVSFNRDGNFNETAVDFWVQGNVLYAACTWIIGERSTFKVVSRTLS